jgi:hypothetical protein
MLLSFLTLEDLRIELIQEEANLIVEGFHIGVCHHGQRDQVINGLQWMQPNSTGSYFSVYAKTQPSTPYKILAHIGYDIYPGNYFHYGIGFYASGSAKFKGISLAYVSPINLRIVEQNTFNAVQDIALGQNSIPDAWFQIENTGSNLNFSYGNNPTTLRQVYTQAVGAFLTPSHVAILGTKNNNFGTNDYFSVLSWTQL